MKPVTNESPDKGFVGAQSVPSASVIRVAPRVSIKDVVGLVGEALKREGWSVLAAFGRVVVKL